jgi:tetratricopeptide (TPR) repeat protein
MKTVVSNTDLQKSQILFSQARVLPDAQAPESSKVQPSPHLLYAVAVSAYLNNDNRALSLFLQNPLATLAEKALIRARKEMKVGRYDIARATLESFATDSPLLNAEKHFLSANLHSHSSLWELALSEAHEAAKFYLMCHNDRGLFLTNYNMSVYSSRSGLDSVSLHYIHEATKYAKTPAHQSLLFRATALEHSRHLRFNEMIEDIEKALTLRSQLDETECATLDSVAADLYFRAGHREQAKQILETLALSKTIRDKARVRLDLILLTALTEKRARLVDGEPPPVINENFEYKARWKVIENLQHGEWSQAQTKWTELQKHFRLRYGADFKCLSEADERSIFMTAVREVMQPSQDVIAAPAPVLSGKLLTLFEILSDAKTALRKDVLIERIWEISYDAQLDSRFETLIERLRKEGRVQIEMVDQTYRLKR